MTTRTEQGRDFAKACGGAGWTHTWIDNLAYQIEHQLAELGPRESVVRVKWMRGVADSLLKELRAHNDLVAACKEILAGLGETDWSERMKTKLRAALVKAGA